MPKQKILLTGLSAFFSLLATACFCQSVQTITDRKDILIGEQVKLKIKTFLPSGFSGRINWMNLPDSIPHFEIIDAGEKDTVLYKDDSQTIEQTIVFTSFDSGKWAFPSLLIHVDPLKDDTTFNLLTDSFAVNVSYSAPDSTNQLRDIKPIMSVAVTGYTGYYILAGAILLLLTAFFVYRYLKKSKKGQPLNEGSKLSAYDEAMVEMSKLNQFNLQDPSDVKQYHSRLADIFKRYLGRKQQRNLLIKTTGDLLVRMTESGMLTENISNLATALRCTDAVKFAKYLPGSSESEDCLQKIKAIINLLEHQSPNPKPLAI